MTNRGDCKYSIGGRVSLPRAVWVKVDEPDYRYEYQRRTGEDVDAIRGLTYLGQFDTDEEAMQTPQLFDDVLHAGDLKYKDMNGDGVRSEEHTYELQSLMRISYAAI